MKLLYRADEINENLILIFHEVNIEEFDICTIRKRRTKIFQSR